MIVLALFITLILLKLYISAIQGYSYTDDEEVNADLLPLCKATTSEIGRELRCKRGIMPEKYVYMSLISEEYIYDKCLFCR